MIVVVGHPLVAGEDGGWRPAGTTAVAAREAARRGATVQVVGKIGDDPAGDDLLIAFARDGVGHAALLRDASRRTPVLVRPSEDDGGGDGEGDADAARLDPPDPAARPALDPADVELGLRYLGDFRAVIVAEAASDALVRVAADAALYAAAELVVVVAPDDPVEGGLPPGALVLGAPGEPEDPGFAALLGEIAAAVDAGASAGQALAAATQRLGASASRAGQRSGASSSGPSPRTSFTSRTTG